MKVETKVSRTNIKNGMYLRDKEFNGITGVTRYSIEFWEEIKGKVGKVIKAELLRNKRGIARLMLTTDRDIKVVLYGCEAGYGGEGPRGTARILKEAGFNSKRVEETVFSKELFTLRKR